MGRLVRISAVTAALVAATFGAPTRSRAQDAPTESDPDRTARARVLFEEGVAHVDAGEWDEAAEKFREALALKDAPAVRYNLASALVALGAYTEAESIVRPLIDDPTADADLKARSQDLLDQIARAAGELTIDVRGATRGVSIRIEGEDVDASSVVHTFALAPRGYTIVVERNGRELERRDVTVTAGQNAQVSIPIAPTAEETAIAAENAPTGEGSGGSDDIISDWRFWTAVGAAVVLAVLLAVVASQ